jgi:hypothetical protein
VNVRSSATLPFDEDGLEAPVLFDDAVLLLQATAATSTSVSASRENRVDTADQVIGLR